MLKVDGLVAYDQFLQNVRRKNAKLPYKNDKSYYRNGGIFPPIFPRFKIDRNEKVFTIGSCFARNIETALLRRGVAVPLASFYLPKGELPHPAPHILNEYNAGTILQRIENSVGMFDYYPEMGIDAVGDNYIDLFLHIHSTPVPRERLLERRNEINSLYKQLPHSEMVVITLGLVECWFDTQHKCYLNRAPSKLTLKREMGRFEFHRLDVDDVVERMSRSMEILRDVGTGKVLLTVSPIPSEATFMPDGAVISNSYAKSVLRVSTEIMRRRFQFIDYFPSYEIATSFGTAGYEDDNVHVSDHTVQQIIDNMVDNFVSGGADVEANYQMVDIDRLAEDFWHALSQNQIDHATEIVSELSNRFPDHWLAYDLMGHIYSRTKNHAQALVSAQKSMELAGRTWGHVARIGRIYEDLGDFDCARKYLSEAASLPNGEEARLWLENLNLKMTTHG